MADLIIYIGLKIKIEFLYMRDSVEKIMKHELLRAENKKIV